jgi:hypothetical protein
MLHRLLHLLLLQLCRLHLLLQQRLLLHCLRRLLLLGGVGVILFTLAKELVQKATCRCQCESSSMMSLTVS